MKKGTAALPYLVPSYLSSPIFFHSFSSLTTANFWQVPESAIFAAVVSSPGMLFSSLSLMALWCHYLCGPSPNQLLLSGAQHWARPSILALSSRADIIGSTFLFSSHSSPCAPWAGTSEVENWHSCWTPTSSPLAGLVSACWVNEWLCCFMRDM